MELQTTPVDECYRCGYDLRGIADDQPCPECGLLAQRSRRFTDELHNTRPKWLRRISLGVWLILASILALAVIQNVSELAEQWMWDNYGMRFYQWRLHMSMAEFELPVSIMMLGVLLLTSPEGYPLADLADRKRRILLRISMLVPLAALIFMHLSLSLLSQGSMYPIYTVAYGSEWDKFARFVDYFLVPAMLTIGTVPFPLLLFLQLRSLAKRARSAHLAEHCAIVGIGTSCALALAALVYLIQSYGDQWSSDPYWTSRSWLPLGLMLTMAVAASLFLLWSLYLLIRFAIAFHKAAGQLKRQWTRDDRSALATEQTAPGRS